MVPQFRQLQMLRYEFWHFVGKKKCRRWVGSEVEQHKRNLKVGNQYKCNLWTYNCTKTDEFLKIFQTCHDPQISQNWSILQVNVYQVRCSVIKNINSSQLLNRNTNVYSDYQCQIDFLLVSSIQLDITSVLHIAFSESFSTFPDQTIPFSFILLCIDSSILGRFLVSESGWKVTKINQKQG